MWAGIIPGGDCDTMEAWHDNAPTVARVAVMSYSLTPFEDIRRTNPAGHGFWSSRDFARVLGYDDYRNFAAVVEKARTACFNSGQRVEDHFV
jgi:hypothetical protein